jgi:hypothetical protein
LGAAKYAAEFVRFSVTTPAWLVPMATLRSVHALWMLPRVAQQLIAAKQPSRIARRLRMARRLLTVIIHMNHPSHYVVVFDTHEKAKAAMKTLGTSGFDPLQRGARCRRFRRERSTRTFDSPASPLALSQQP